MTGGGRLPRGWRSGEMSRAEQVPGRLCQEAMKTHSHGSSDLMWVCMFLKCWDSRTLLRLGCNSTQGAVMKSQQHWRDQRAHLENLTAHASCSWEPRILSYLLTSSYPKKVKATAECTGLEMMPPEQHMVGSVLMGFNHNNQELPTVWSSH